MTAEAKWSEGIAANGLAPISWSPSVGFGSPFSHCATSAITRRTSPFMRPSFSETHHGGAVGTPQ